MLASFLAVAALLASQAAASTFKFSSTDSLGKRTADVQVSNVPAACEDKCEAVHTLFNTCDKIDTNTALDASKDCFCGDFFHRTFTNCLACTAGADSIRTGSLTIQLRDYENACESAGRDIPTLPLKETSLSGSTPPSAPENNGGTPGTALFAGTLVALVGTVGAAIAVLA